MENNSEKGTPRRNENAQFGGKPKSVYHSKRSTIYLAACKRTVKILIFRLDEGQKRN